MFSEAKFCSHSFNNSAVICIFRNVNRVLLILLGWHIRPRILLPFLFCPEFDSRCEQNFSHNVRWKSNWLPLTWIAIFSSFDKAGRVWFSKIFSLNHYTLMRSDTAQKNRHKFSFSLCFYMRNSPFQSHYIEVAQGGIFSRAIHNWLWILSLFKIYN